MSTPSPIPESGVLAVEGYDDPTIADSGTAEPSRRASVRRVLRRLRTNPTFLIGASLVLFWILSAVGWRWLAPYSPFAVSSDRLQGPGFEHFLGTDQLGRDTFSRVLAGAESVLLIAPAAVILATIGGTALALIAGYYGGPVDDVLMRTTDGVLAFPLIIPLMIILALVGPSKKTILCVLAVTYIFLIAPVVRSLVLVERQKEYVDAARLRGEKGFYITTKEILPNITGPIIVEMTVRIGYAIFFIGALSFLGLGLQPPSSDWGLMISQQRTYVDLAPWTVIGPAVAIASLIIGVNLVADALNKALAR
jgi:peptide/nickel transport system permease protein